MPLFLHLFASLAFFQIARGCTPSTTSSAITNVGTIQGSGSYSTQYGCFNSGIESLSNTEIRYIGVYESSLGDHGHGKPRISGAITLTLENCNNNYDINHQIILVLTSYEPVDWIIRTDDTFLSDNLVLYAVYVSGYYTSTITFENVKRPVLGAIISSYESRSGNYFYGYKNPTSANSIYLQYNTEVYGFLGTYRTDSGSICVGGPFQDKLVTHYPTANTVNPSNTPTKNPTATVSPTMTPTTTPTRPPSVTQACENINYYRCGPNSWDTQCFSVYSIGRRMDTPPYCDTSVGECRCSYPYNRFSCLPELYGCNICPYTEPIEEVGNTFSSQYGCLNANYESLGDSGVEIRIIGVYESSNGDHGFGVERQSGEITVTLTNCNEDESTSFEGLILVLSSYEPVDWIIKKSDQFIGNLIINKIYLTGYYTSNIQLDGVPDPTNGITITSYELRNGDYYYGYGSDTGGGNTVGLIEYFSQLYNTEIYSFIGTYAGDKITQCVGTSNEEEEEEEEIIIDESYSYLCLFIVDLVRHSQGDGNNKNNELIIKPSYKFDDQDSCAETETQIMLTIKMKNPFSTICECVQIPKNTKPCITVIEEDVNEGKNVHSSGYVTSDDMIEGCSSVRDCYTDILLHTNDEKQKDDAIVRIGYRLLNYNVCQDNQAQCFDVQSVEC